MGWGEMKEEKGISALADTEICGATWPVSTGGRNWVSPSFSACVPRGVSTQ